MTTTFAHFIERDLDDIATDASLIGFPQVGVSTEGIRDASALRNRVAAALVHEIGDRAAGEFLDAAAGVDDLDTLWRVAEVWVYLD